VSTDPGEKAENGDTNHVHPWRESLSVDPVIAEVQTCRISRKPPSEIPSALKSALSEISVLPSGTGIAQSSCAITLNNSTGGKKFTNLNRELLPGEG